MERLTHRPTTLRAANAFVSAHHRHNGASQGHKFALEARFGDELVGVVIVGRPLARKLDDGLTAEVLRCCVKSDAPRNTASYLYGAARRVWQAQGGSKVVTYNLQSESGASLRAAGFVLIAKVAPEPKGWARKGRKRGTSSITGERKNRWQLELPMGCAA